MSAFSIASKEYEPESLGWIISVCANSGFLYAEDDVFVCAVPISRRNLNSDNEIQSKLELDEHDTWFIYVASGNLKKAFSKIPKLKYIAFERFDDRVRVYDFERLRRLVWAV